MELRPYQKIDSPIICSWVTDEAALYKWSADRIGHFPLNGNELNEEYFGREYPTPMHPMTMLDDEGALAGHILMRFPDPKDLSHIRFGFVIVDSSKRGQGLGRKMLELAKEYAVKKLGAKKIDLGVFSSNPAAIKCYQAAGFSEEGEREIFTCPAGEWERIGMEFIPREPSENNSSEELTGVLRNEGKTGATKDEGKTSVPGDEGKTGVPGDERKTGASKDEGKTGTLGDEEKIGAPKDKEKTIVPKVEAMSGVAGDEGKTGFPGNEEETGTLKDEKMTSSGIVVGLDARTILDSLAIKGKTDLRTMNPLVLAHVGDAVYELVIRTLLSETMDTQIQKIHRKCTDFVNCHAQFELMHKIEDMLTDEEHAVYKRARNTKSYTMPKNAVPVEYRTATGFEALCGWLYLSGRTDRLLSLLKEALAEAFKPSQA